MEWIPTESSLPIERQVVYLYRDGQKLLGYYYHSMFGPHWYLLEGPERYEYFPKEEFSHWHLLPPPPEFPGPYMKSEKP